MYLYVFGSYRGVVEQRQLSLDGAFEGHGNRVPSHGHLIPLRHSAKSEGWIADNCPVLDGQTNPRCISSGMVELTSLKESGGILISEG